MEQQVKLNDAIDQALPSLVAIYKQIHASPELSHQEEKTSALLARQLRSLGDEVTEHIGKYPNPDWKGYGVTGTAEWSRRARAIAVGTFDDPNWIKPATHIWTRSALHWMAFPAAVQVIETVPQIDVGSFLSENFPPHVHGENCPECVAVADLSRPAICCEGRDLHVLAPVEDRELFRAVPQS